MEVTGLEGMEASTTPPARLQDEIDEVPTEPMNENVDKNNDEMRETPDNIGAADSDNETENREKILEGQEDEQEWKSSRRTDEDGVGEDETEFDYRQSEYNEEGAGMDADYDETLAENEAIAVPVAEDNEDIGDKNGPLTENDLEALDEKDEDEDPKFANMKMEEEEERRVRGPIIRFLIRTGSSRRRNPAGRIGYRSYRPGFIRNLDYRKYQGPRNLRIEDDSDEFRVLPSFDRPSLNIYDMNRNYRSWRGKNKGLKKGISLTQVFVNKPHPPPMVSYHPPAPFMNTYMSPYHSALSFGYPPYTYTRSLSIKGKQRSGGPPHISGTYQATSWPGFGPRTQIQVNFAPKAGEPNLACLQPPAVHNCFFGIPSLRPFWYFDARAGKCSYFFVAGCDTTLNKFDSRSECEATCLGKFQHSFIYNFTKSHFLLLKQ